MRYRYQYSFDEETGKISITGLPFKIKFVEVPREKGLNGFTHMV